ncbi:hypothetical protein FFLO_03869 [Filobasidium floriforme]|uniref:Protein kinase domain-containing protein n=1 Tax=Filobasidium floriforme TaxID=5210 RepID=A0A8K0JK99_9TREE|nr:hypothetical protein FFLO_03869 [Filobasidium floriforme]
MLHNFFRQSPRSSHRKKDYDFGPAGSLPIGEGGSGQVMRARSKDGRCVAVKVVRKEAVMEHSEYLKILHDGFDRIHDNRNICKYTFWFESSHKYYLVFPLMTGGELLERLNTRGRFTEEAVKRIMLRILDTLSFIHSHGIIHRDIKPDNFLYRSEDSAIDDVVLIDFGISKILDKNQEGTTDPKTQIEVAGTPGYAAPEVFLKTGYGKNQDVFGVGVIAYNLLSASTPWRSRGYADLIRESMRAEVDFPPGPFRGVSEQAILFVKYLMQPDPHARPSSAQALDHPWLTSRQTQPSAARRIPTGIREEAEEHHSPSSPEDVLGRTPVEPVSTLKPDHPVARQITAIGVEAIRE